MRIARMDDGTDSGGEEGQRLAGLQLFAPRPHLRPAASEPQSVFFFQFIRQFPFG